jgi:hypothetical protein
MLRTTPVATFLGLIILYNPVTTPVIDPVNGYNTGFTATPAIAFGNSLCFNHGMPSRRRQQGNLERICLSIFTLQESCTIGNSSPSPLHALSVGQIYSEGMDSSLPRLHPVTHPCKRIECGAFACELKM